MIRLACVGTYIPTYVYINAVIHCFMKDRRKAVRRFKMSRKKFIASSEITIYYETNHWKILLISLVEHVKSNSPQLGMCALQKWIERDRAAVGIPYVPIRVRTSHLLVLGTLNICANEGRQAGVRVSFTYPTYLRLKLRSVPRSRIVKNSNTLLGIVLFAIKGTRKTCTTNLLMSTSLYVLLCYWKERRETRDR